MTNSYTGGSAFPMQDSQAIHSYAQAKVELLSSARVDKPLSTNERDAEYIQARAEAVGGLTVRQYAAIALKVPASGTDWLDDMIRKSLRIELAGKIAQGYVVETERPNACVISEVAYRVADAMLEAGNV